MRRDAPPVATVGVIWNCFLLSVADSHHEKIRYESKTPISESIGVKTRQQGRTRQSRSISCAQDQSSARVGGRKWDMGLRKIVLRTLFIQNNCFAQPVTALHCTHTTYQPHQNVVQQKQQVAVGSGYAFDAGFGLSRSQP